jgi:hypothetical protein
MKNIKWLSITLLSALFFVIPVNLNASFTVDTKSAFPSSDALMNLKASEFVKLSLKDISSLTGKELSLKEKVSFKLMNKRMKHAVKKKPDLTVNDYLADGHKLSSGWKIVLLVGFIIIFIAFIIAEPFVS